MYHLNVFGEEYNQTFVDNLVMEAEHKAEICKDEEVAISLLQDIQQLTFLSKAFFVPDIIFSWEEMALSYIESENSVFEFVYLPKMLEIYDRGIEALMGLEQYVLNDAFSEVVLFNLTYNFNLDVKSFNQHCKNYNHKLFEPFIIQDHILYSKYKIFIGESKNE